LDWTSCIRTDIDALKLQPLLLLQADSRTWNCPDNRDTVVAELEECLHECLDKTRDPIGFLSQRMVGSDNSQPHKSAAVEIRQQPFGKKMKELQKMVAVGLPGQSEEHKPMKFLH
jgi:hypothetical protein